MSKDGNDDMGGRIRERRKLAGLTQSALASAIGVSFQQVQKYEKNLSAIPADRLRRICDALGLPPDYYATPLSDFIGVAVAASGAPSAAGRAAFVDSAEGRRLVEAFMRIADPLLRTRVLDFIASLGDGA